jgi:hypothetical protein
LGTHSALLQFPAGLQRLLADDKEQDLKAAMKAACGVKNDTITRTLIEAGKRGVGWEWHGGNRVAVGRWQRGASGAMAVGRQESGREAAAECRSQRETAATTGQRRQQG